MLHNQNVLVVMSLVVLTILCQVDSAVSGTWVSKADMPTARAGACAAVVNGKIYVIGGGTDFLNLDPMIVEVYDPATDKWEKIPGGPEKGRIFCSASVVNGKIYVIGGAASGTALAIVEEYDPTTNTWTRKSDMPTARASLATAVVDGKIYAIGGTSNPRSRFSNLATVEMYDPMTDSWTDKVDMPTARMGLVASTVNGKIYAIKGFINEDRHVSTTEEYDPVADKWQSRSELAERKVFAAAAEVNGKIYVVGGALFVTVNSSAEEYDPEEDTWKMIDPLQTPREAPAAAAVNGKIYVFGGCTSAMNTTTTIVPSLASVEEYDTGYTPPKEPMGNQDIKLKNKLTATWGEIKNGN